MVFTSPLGLSDALNYRFISQIVTPYSVIVITTKARHKSQPLIIIALQSSFLFWRTLEVLFTIFQNTWIVSHANTILKELEMVLKMLKSNCLDFDP